MRLQREMTQCNYVIQPRNVTGKWLGIEIDNSQPNSFKFVLRHQIFIFQVTAHSFNTLKKKLFMIFQLAFALKNSNDKIMSASISINAILGNYKITSRDMVSCKLYYDNKQYCRYNEALDKLESTTDYSEATDFEFIKYSSSHLITKTSLVCLKMKNKKTLLTKEYLQDISHKAIISCQEILKISVSYNFPSELLQSALGADLKNILVQIFNFIVDDCSSFIVADSQLVDANIVLVLPGKSKEPIKYKGNSIAKVSLSLYDVKTLYQNVTLQLQQDGAGESISIDLTHFIEYQKYIQSFPKYLHSLLGLDAPEKLKVYDAVILLLQSELDGYKYMSKIAQTIVGLILEWDISYLKSAVQFVPFASLSNCN